MHTEIVVPTLGESVTEATVAKWFKAVGDSVDLDERLVEIETDKVTLEINAAAAGTLGEILAPEGESVSVGAVLGVIGEAAAPPPSGAAEKLSPAARELVEKHGFDPAVIPATGKGGRLTKGDVLAYAKASAEERPDGPAPVREEARRPSAAPAAPREERVRMTQLRRRIAQRLKEARTRRRC